MFYVSALLVLGAAGEVSPHGFVKEVLARHPGQKAAEEAVAAVRARVSQAFAFQDPQLSYSLAPMSVSSSARTGQELRLSQQFPALGAFGRDKKLREADVRSAQAARTSVQLRLAEEAWRLLAEMEVLEKSLAVNAQHREAMESFKASAEAQYASGNATSQDVLLAEIERALLQEENIQLLSQKEKTAAALSALYRKTADEALPTVRFPSPAAPQVLEPSTLWALARRHRPEIQALGAQKAQGEWRAEAAAASYVPAFEVMTSYNSMWDMPEHRFMVGVGMNVPLPWNWRRAGVDEAGAMQRQLEAEFDALELDIRREVTERVSMLNESTRLLKLYQDSLLPPTQDRLQVALGGFIAGRGSFQALLDAERALRNVELKLARTKAQWQERAALLELSLGQLPGTLFPESP